MTPSWQVDHSNKEVYLDHILFLQLACMGFKIGESYSVFVGDEYVGYAVMSESVKKDNGITEYPLTFYPHQPIEYIKVDVSLKL